MDRSNSTVARVRFTHRLKAATAFATLIGVAPHIAHAQSAEEPTGRAVANANPQSDSAALGDIVVTAQKRSESLQRVPLAVTAISGDSLTSSNTNNTADLQLKTPGLVLTTNGPFGQPYIRGIGTDILGAGSDPSVAVNIDGVYLTRPTAAIQDFYDVDRVEVVKGPQGTLYGRNATGGAINIISAEPQTDFGAGADVTVGNYSRIRATGYLNVPTSDDTALRLSGIRASRDGYTKLITASGERRNGSQADEDTFGGRAQFLAKPAPGLKILLAADYLRENDSQFLNNRPNPDFASVAPALGLGAIVPPSVRRSTADREQYALVKDWGLRSTITYELGAIDLKSISSYRYNSYDAQYDIDGTNLNFAWDTEGAESRTFTQELQASQSVGRFRWIVGAYYLHERATSYYDVRFGGDSEPVFHVGLTSPEQNLSIAVANARNTTDALAVFGQANYDVTDALTLTVGGRYSTEKKDFALNDELAGSTLKDAHRWSAFTPKFGIEYRLSSNGLLYASVTKGFKSGGYNADGVGERFNPETIWSYEAGAKITSLDGRLRTNLSAFYYDYTDLQARIRDPLGTNAIVANVGSAKLYGAELDVQARPTSALLLISTVRLVMVSRYTTVRPVRTKTSAEIVCRVRRSGR